MLSSDLLTNNHHSFNKKKNMVLIAGSVSRSVNLHECNLKMQDVMLLNNG